MWRCATSPILLGKLLWLKRIGAQRLEIATKLAQVDDWRRKANCKAKLPIGRAAGIARHKSGVNESVPEFPYLRRLSRLHLCNDWLAPFFLQGTLS
jgi:hypothetical protein